MYCTLHTLLLFTRLPKGGKAEYPKLLTKPVVIKEASSDRNTNAVQGFRSLLGDVFHNNTPKCTTSRPIDVASYVFFKNILGQPGAFSGAEIHLLAGTWDPKLGWAGVLDERTIDRNEGRDGCVLPTKRQVTASK